jgi:hypothetical protein
MNRKITEGKHLQATGEALMAYARRIGDGFTLLVGKRLVVKGIARVLEGMRAQAAAPRRLERA